MSARGVRGGAMAGALVAAVAAVLVGACTQVASDPTAVVAITFDSLPYPAVVGGDTLRLESGAPTFLRAAALNSEGDTIVEAPMTFVLLDAGATISENGVLASTDPAVTSLRVLAQSAGLQSRPLTLIVTPRPESLARDGTVADTLRYVLPDDATNVSQPIGARVFSTAAEPPVNARGWIVRYSFELASDAARAFFVDESNRRSPEDTAAADGRVSRRVRVDAAQVVPAPAMDSLVVLVTATAYGAPLAGSPVRVVLRLVPR